MFLHVYLTKLFKPVLALSSKWHRNTQTSCRLQSVSKPSESWSFHTFTLTTGAFTRSQCRHEVRKHIHVCVWHCFHIWSDCLIWITPLTAASPHFLQLQRYCHCITPVFTTLSTVHNKINFFCNRYFSLNISKSYIYSTGQKWCPELIFVFNDPTRSII